MGISILLGLGRLRESSSYGDVSTVAVNPALIFLVKKVDLNREVLITSVSPEVSLAFERSAGASVSALPRTPMAATKCPSAVAGWPHSGGVAVRSGFRKMNRTPVVCWTKRNECNRVYGVPVLPDEAD